jgi:hypothetical protein
MRTFPCATEGCAGTIAWPVQRGRRPQKCDTCKGAPAVRRERIRKAKSTGAGVGTIPAPAASPESAVSAALREAREAVERLANAEREAATPPKVTAPLPDGLTHYAFGKLLRHLRCGRQPYLCGPSGSGKTYAAEQAAKAIGAKTFDVLACNAETSGIDFFGYMDANGNYVPGIIYDAWKFGGVVLFDEMDACEPNALLKANAVLAMSAGSVFRFPNGERIPRHPDFRPISAGNTTGHGADANYSGRESLDASSLTRWTMILWGYDETLERAMVPAEHVWWAERVQALRKAARAAGASIIITPRSTIDGVAFLADGEATVDEIHDECVWKGAPADTRNAVLAHV